MLTTLAVRRIFKISILAACFHWGFSGFLLNAQSLDASSETVKEFSYKANSLRDPFVPITVTGMTGSVRTSMTNAQGENTYASVADIETAFRPDSLIVKAILKDSKAGVPMALLASSDNSDDNFMVKGSKIRHLATGLTLTSFEARIEADTVVIKKTKGEPLMAVVSFPKEEESLP